jgi:hypothetical protein
LGPLIEQGVLAAEIGPQRIPTTTAIPQKHGVFFARSAAVGMVVPIGEKGAKQAVFHVEQGHVLVNSPIYLPWRTAPYLGEQLPLLQKPGGREWIGEV